MRKKSFVDCFKCQEIPLFGVENAQKRKVKQMIQLQSCGGKKDFDVVILSTESVTTRLPREEDCM